MNIHDAKSATLRCSFLLPALLVLLVAAEADAAQSYDSCTGFIDSVPATITSQGIWCLRHDVSTAITSGAAITIAANNTTIDCNDFKIGGLAAGAGTNTGGIVTDTLRVNSTVRNCRIRGFRKGIGLSGTSALVEDNTLDHNTAVGIGVSGDNAIIQRNTIHDTGGGVPEANVQGIIAEGVWAQVIDNDVHGVGGPDAFIAGGPPTIGILVGQSSFVQHNRISMLDDSHAAISIANNTVARDNIVTQPRSGLQSSWGMACANQDDNLVLDNQFFGFSGFPDLFDLPFYRCHDTGGNVTFGNASA